jgi:hypothetical protein
MAYTTMLVQYNSLKVNTFFEGTDPSRVQLFVVLDKITHTKELINMLWYSRVI